MSIYTALHPTAVSMPPIRAIQSRPWREIPLREMSVADVSQCPSAGSRAIKKAHLSSNLRNASILKHFCGLASSTEPTCAPAYSYLCLLPLRVRARSQLERFFSPHRLRESNPLSLGRVSRSGHVHESKCSCLPSDCCLVRVTGEPPNSLASSPLRRC